MFQRNSNGSLGPGFNNDSLADDSVQDRPYEQQKLGNGYDFLLDEDYQALKASQEQMQLERWQVMGVKASFMLQLEEIMTGLLYQQQLMTGQMSAKERPRNLREVTREIKSQMELNNRQIQLLKSEVTTAQAQGLAYKEQARALDQQLQKALASHRTNKDSLASLPQSNRHELQLQEQEQYIQELETQLQESRKHLLEKKLNLTDKDDQLSALKRQITSLESNFQKLEDEKRDIDALVIKVSQELRGKEYDMRDFNYQIATEKDTLGRQVDLLKKELQEEKERRNTLEMLESDLIHKADVKHQEVQQLQTYLQEIEDKLQVKSEAIEKAQKVIERLNEEFDKVTLALARTENERDQARSELRETSRRVVELNKQIQNVQNQHQTNQQHVSHALKGEIDELKEALHQYQQQFEEEKRALALSLREANEDKYKMHIDKEKAESSLRKQLQSLQDQYEHDKNSYYQSIAKLESDHKEEKEDLLHIMQNKEEQSQSQIKYLHRRLKEVSHDQGPNSTTNANKSSLCYLAALKQEFESLAQDVQETRALVKSTNLQDRMQVFEGFQSKVLNALEQWEVKAEELAALSQRYEAELNEQKRIFISMRQLLKEKDMLISSMQKLGRQKDQTKELQAQTLKKELERQTYLIKAELLDQFKHLQHSTYSIHEDKQDIEKRFSSFKQEYMQLLDIKDQLQQQSQRLQMQMDIAQSEVGRLSQDHQDFSLRVIQTLRQVIGRDTSNSILQDLEEAVDELKVRREEVLSYKDQVYRLDQQTQDDKKFLMQKVQAVEEQLMLIQRQNLSKEEEQQVQFLQKETKYLNECEKLKADMASITQSNGTRERQVKKLQLQVDEKDQVLSETQGRLEAVKQELGEKTEDIRSIQVKCEDLLVELATKEKELSLVLQELDASSHALKRTEDHHKYLREQLLEREAEVSRERELNQQLQEEKYQALNLAEAAQEKTGILERENQNIYKDLVIARDRVRELDGQLNQADDERQELRYTCQHMTDVLAQVQQEVSDSQRAVDHLNHSLEVMRRKNMKTKDLKHQLRLLKASEQQLKDIIEGLRRQLHPYTQTMGCQTEAMQAMELLDKHPDFQNYRASLLTIQSDMEMLQEAVHQRNNEITRLIAEKRDLEDLVSQHSQTLKQLKLGQKENYNALNTNRESELYSRILQEKENYIMRLEQEMGEMRRDSDQLKDKLIGYEIGSLSLDTRSLGGARRSHQISQQYPPFNQSTSKGKHPMLNTSTMPMYQTQQQPTQATSATLNFGHSGDAY